MKEYMRKVVKRQQEVRANNEEKSATKENERQEK